jgi:hypothetical protein
MCSIVCAFGYRNPLLLTWLGARGLGIVILMSNPLADEGIGLNHTVVTCVRWLLICSVTSI